MLIAKLSRDLHNALLCTVLQSHLFKFCKNYWSFFTSANSCRNFEIFCRMFSRFCQIVGQICRNSLRIGRGIKINQKGVKISQAARRPPGVWIEPAKICALMAGLASSSARPAAALRDKQRCVRSRPHVDGRGFSVECRLDVDDLGGSSRRNRPRRVDGIKTNHTFIPFL